MAGKLVNIRTLVLVAGIGIYMILKYSSLVSSILLLGGLVIGWLLIEAEKRVMVLLREQTTHQILLTPLVLAIFFFFSLFLLVTSLSPIAHGIVLGFGLRVCMTAVVLMEKPEQLRSVFFWQINDITQQQMRWVVAIYIGLFFLLAAIS